MQRRASVFGPLGLFPLHKLTKLTVQALLEPLFRQFLEEASCEFRPYRVLGRWLRAALGGIMPPSEKGHGPLSLEGSLSGKRVHKAREEEEKS
jgi:hypothetical protein